MNTHQSFFSISDWWNYSSAAGDAVTGGSLHEYLLDGRADAHGGRDLAVDTPSGAQSPGVIAAAIAQAASEAASAGRDTLGWQRLDAGVLRGLERKVGLTLNRAPRSKRNRS